MIIKLIDLDGLQIELQNIDHININFIGESINCYFEGLENCIKVITLQIYKYYEIIAIEKGIVIYRYSKDRKR